MIRLRFLPAALLLIADFAGLAAPILPSVERFYKGDASTLVEAGEILLTELHCVNCHAPGPQLEQRIPVTTAPVLDGVTSRLQQDYLIDFLSDSHATNPNARMPDLLSQKSPGEREAIARELTEFLTTSFQPRDRIERMVTGNPERGRELFHSIGCIACHAPRADFVETVSGTKVDAASVESPVVPLIKLAEKYERRGLIGFLLKPEETRPAGRMPNFNLTPQEAADVASYLLGESKPTTVDNLDKTPLATDKGQSLFASLGCASCHSSHREAQAVASAIEAKALTLLTDRSGGCLNPKATAGIPHYLLTDFQRRALTAALNALPSLVPLAPSHKARREMVRLNCFSCHERDGWGGPDRVRLKYFVSSGADLGDEGREPPLLTGVGRKMQAGAIEQTIRGQFPSRPYMVTRMPGYRAVHARRLTDWFAEADADPDERPTPRDGLENQVGRNMWGRALIGTEGLSCITCHLLNGNPSLGIPAMDLALAPKRLRPEWFRDYLIDPPKFRSGTRMPAFWPEGEPMAPGNGTTTARQIDSIWVYLNEIDQSRLPVGMEDKADLLVRPKERPVVFRTFMERVGNHAVAVGFKTGTHAAFDSRMPRWAIAWTGEFLNAESTWEDRFTPMAEPAGENAIAIQPHPPQQVGDVKSLGYRLDLESGVPTFRYQIADVEFADTMEPSTGEQASLSRQLRVVRGRGSRWLEVASGSSIVPVDGHWMIDGLLRVSTAAPVRIVRTLASEHLQVRVDNAGNGPFETVVSYNW